MTLRDWIGAKLQQDEYGRPTGVVDVTVEGPRSLKATREELPPAYIYCADGRGTEPFTPGELDAALEEMPQVQFVVVTRRREIANSAFAYADARGVAIGGLSTLQIALRSHTDVGTYKSRNHTYVQGRFNAHRKIENWRRVGYDAYEIERPGDLRTLVIITLNPYEVTQEEAYRLINAHPEVQVDALVNTNPSCNGFSPNTLEAVSHTGVEIMTLSDFLYSLGQPWEN